MQCAYRTQVMLVRSVAGRPLIQHRLKSRLKYSMRKPCLDVIKYALVGILDLACQHALGMPQQQRQQLVSSVKLMLRLQAYHTLFQPSRPQTATGRVPDTPQAGSAVRRINSRDSRYKYVNVAVTVAARRAQHVETVTPCFSPSNHLYSVFTTMWTLLWKNADCNDKSTGFIDQAHMQRLDCVHTPCTHTCHHLSGGFLDWSELVCTVPHCLSHHDE